MNHVEFIEKNIKQSLLAEGIRYQSLKAGQTLELTITTAALKPARKGRCLMTVYDWLRHGPSRTQPQLTRQTLSEREHRKPTPQHQPFSKEKAEQCSNTFSA